MKMLYTILFFIFGTVFGSFYNVVGFRLSLNKSIIKPRSHCMNCNHELSWYEMIPIFSYIFLGGKCSKCKQKISIFYPLMELFCGILFAVSYYSYGFSYDILIALGLSSMFIIITVSDLNYYIIPDQVTIFFSIYMFIANILRLGFIDGFKYLGFGVIMFLFMYLLMLLGNLIFKEESLGGGDIKLLFVLGMTSPIVMSFFGVALAAFIALPISIYLYFRKKDKIVPFGPFLVGAFLLLTLFKLDINDVYNFIENISF